MTEEKATVRVVSAIIIRDGRLLLQQRRPGCAYPLQWETPGGKVEVGETTFAALRRELDEEISLMDCDIAVWSATTYRKAFAGAEVLVPRPWSISFDRLVVTPSWQPLARGAVGIGWFRPAEIAPLELTPGTSYLREAARLCEEGSPIWTDPTKESYGE